MKMVGEAERNPNVAVERLNCDNINEFKKPENEKVNAIEKWEILDALSVHSNECWMKPGVYRFVR